MSEEKRTVSESEAPLLIESPKYPDECSAGKNLGPSSTRSAVEAKLRAAVRDAFEHGVCVKARFTTRGDQWRVKHAEAIQIALGPEVK